MNYVKNTAAYAVMISMLLSTAQNHAVEWSYYLPSGSMWERAKQTASSYINPAWQSFKSSIPTSWQQAQQQASSAWQSAKEVAPYYKEYAIPLGLTALGSAIGGTTAPYSYAPKTELLSGLGAMSSPMLQAFKRNRVFEEGTERQPTNESALWYVGNIAATTAAAMIPILIKAYLQGKIDRITFRKLLQHPMVAQAMFMSGLGAASMMAVEAEARKKEQRLKQQYRQEFEKEALQKAKTAEDQAKQELEQYSQEEQRIQSPVPELPPRRLSLP